MRIKQAKSSFTLYRRQLDCRRMLVAIVVVILIQSAATICHANTASTKRKATEYQIKAIYLYNFLLFTEWPPREEPGKEHKTENSEPPLNEKNKDDAPQQQGTITIGILGRDPFGDSFAKVEGKVIKSHNKKLIIKRFGTYNENLDLTQCDLLFVCLSEKNKLKQILPSLKRVPILTVAGSPGFLEKGIMINFVTKEKKVRWEINQAPIKLAQLKLSSQLFRNAVRVVEIPKLLKNTSKGKNKGNTSRIKLPPVAAKTFETKA